MSLRHLWISAAMLAWAAPALAHDFWLQPRAFWIPPQSRVSTALQIGHGPDRQAWPSSLDRILMLTSVSAAGRVDHRPELKSARPGQPLDLPFKEAGVHVLAMQTSHAESVLPADRFNAYLEEEGLTPALALRERGGQTGAPGREIYSRRGKVLVQVGQPGPAAQAQVTTPIGMTLEIVPERNPYTLAPDQPLPVRILYEGRPLPGALVKLTNLDFDGKPVETRRSDAAGRASFDVPRVGSWLINVIWTKPIAGNPRAEFDTTFSSLTFGYPRGRPPQ